MNHFTTSKVAACLALIFVAGGAAGAVITWKNAHGQETQSVSMEKTCNRLQDRLVSRLGLTPDQVRKLKPVFDQTARDIGSIHSKAIRDTDDIICRAHEQIARELTPEQKLKLDTFDKERRDWLRRHFQDAELPAILPKTGPP
jgi:hypothetical protein